MEPKCLAEMYGAPRCKYGRCVDAQIREDRLRAWAEDEQRKRHRAEEDRMNLRSELERRR
jgi:hypothetical protein